MHALRSAMLRRALVASSIALAAPAAPARLAAQSPMIPVATPVPTINTSGQGEAKLAPDRVSVMINVQTRATTASAAGADNARRITAVLEALAKLGLTKDQLTTQGYSVNPELMYRNNESPRVVAYVVTNTVRAESKRVEQAGPIVDAALGAGANMINGLSFYASNIDGGRREAITAAVASARADAEAMARAAGGSLGELLEMSTNGPIQSPRPMYDMQMRGKLASAEAASTPVNPGEQTIQAYVSARWRFVAGQ